jgi:hypothetical protein
MHGENTYGNITIKKALKRTTSFYGDTGESDKGKSKGKGKCQISKKIPELPDIPIETITTQVTSICDLLKVFHRYYYIREDYAVIGPMCVAVLNFLPNDPSAWVSIAPSGSMKTETLRSFGERQNQFVYPVSHITENTFISGFEKNIDLVPQLRGRLVVGKDFTTWLSEKDDKKSKIFAQLREVLDMYIKANYGSGVEREYSDIHSSFLFACTNEIERYYLLISRLGARLMFMRPKGDPDKASERAEQNQERMLDIRHDVHTAVMGFLDYFVNKLDTEPQSFLQLPRRIKDELREYANFLAKVRTFIHRDRMGDISAIPEPEFPTRILNNLTTIARVHAFVHNREPNDCDKLFALRIVWDNIPSMRAAALPYLSREYNQSGTLSEKMRLPTRVVSRILDDLVALEICEKLDRGSVKEVSEELDARANQYRLANDDYHFIVQALKNTTCNSYTCTLEDKILSQNENEGEQQELTKNKRNGIGLDELHVVSHDCSQCEICNEEGIIHSDEETAREKENEKERTPEVEAILKELIKIYIKNPSIKPDGIHLRPWLYEEVFKKTNIKPDFTNKVLLDLGRIDANFYADLLQAQAVATGR